MRNDLTDLRSAAWRRNLADLRTIALPVTMQTPAVTALSPRKIAACLRGILSVVVQRWNVETMQRSCAELVRYDPAWRETSFGLLPPGPDGAPTEPVAMIAMATSGLLNVCTKADLRAALAWWASEDSPSAWTEIAA